MFSRKILSKTGFKQNEIERINLFVKFNLR